MPDPVVPPVVPPVAPPVVPPAGDPWYKGAPDEIVGHLRNRGWDQKPVNEVALAAIQSHREAEKLIGAPADQMVRLPKDKADADGWKAVWQRLGAPADPKDYDFSALKRADGSALDAGLVDALRLVAGANSLPKEAAAAVAAGIVKHLDQTAATAKNEAEIKLAAERQDLDKLWDVNKDANKFIAQNAAKKLGIDPEAVAKLEGQVGYAKVMEMFRRIGVSTGEARFLDSGGSKPGVMTREEAVSRKAELRNDKAWVTKYLAGDTVAKREMLALEVLITGDTGDYRA